MNKKTILLIEDDLDVLSMMTKHLKHFGYEVLVATDGMEGLKRLETDRFDLVITDIVMPYVSGIGVVRAVKEKMPQTPVIAITGYGKEPEAAAMERKADLVLAKPVKMSVLKGHIARLIRSGSRENES
jgi:DNA-binding response OmpR family regulator